MRDKAKEAIGALGPGAVPYLVAGIQHASLYARTACMQLLGAANARNATKAAIIKRPQVIVSTAEAGVYYLYGYVNRPGQYPLMRAMTVQQAIAAGGGIAPLGTEWRIQLKRRMPDGQVMEKSAKLDDDVEPNDTVVVNERLF